MKSISISVAFASLIGCVSSPKQALQPDIQIASQEEIDGAIRDVLECASAAIRTYDDTISPANTVGKAVRVRCWQEVSALALVSTKGMDADTEFGFMQAFDPEEMFTAMVLKNRTRN